MNWLGNNWIWIAVAIGAFYFMTRMHGTSRGMGHSMGRGYGRDGGDPPADRGTGSNITFDPVSRRAVTAGGSTIAAVYHGRAYYFENREDRDAFEADPEKYIAVSPAAGQAIGSEDAYRERPRRRGGC